MLHCCACFRRHALLAPLALAFSAALYMLVGQCCGSLRLWAPRWRRRSIHSLGAIVVGTSQDLGFAPALQCLCWGVAFRPNRRSWFALWAWCSAGRI